MMFWICSASSWRKVGALSMHFAFSYEYAAPLTNLDVYSSQLEQSEALFRPHGALVKQFRVHDDTFEIYSARATCKVNLTT